MGLRCSCRVPLWCDSRLWLRSGSSPVPRSKRAIDSNPTPEVRLIKGGLIGFLLSKEISDIHNLQSLGVQQWLTGPTFNDSPMVTSPLFTTSLSPGSGSTDFPVSASLNSPLLTFSHSRFFYAPNHSLFLSLSLCRLTIFFGWYKNVGISLG